MVRFVHLLSATSGTITHAERRREPTATIAARPSRRKKSGRASRTHTPTDSSARYPVMKWHAIVSAKAPAARAYDSFRATARHVSAQDSGRSHIAHSCEYTP